MKTIVYYASASMSPSYVVHLILGGQTYAVFERQVFEVEGSDIRAIIPRPHIIVRNSEGEQVHLLTGDFIGEFDSDKAAKRHIGRLVHIRKVMES